MSYVVNDGPRSVAPSTRARVLAAINDLGYRRDSIARSLRAGSTGTIGVVVPDLTKPFFAELAAALEQRAADRGSAVLVATSQFSDTAELALVERLLQSRVDGVVVVPAGTGTAVAEHLRSAGVPAVVLHRRLPGFPSVVAADKRAGEIAAHHLYQHGHRQIACLTGAGAGSPVVERTEGFLSELARYQVHVLPEWILGCGYADLHGDAYRATLRLLAATPEITGLCATTDEHALGALRAASVLGRKVGVDLALVSIDGTSNSAFLTPALTTVSLAFDGMAAAALDRLKPESSEGTEPLVVPVRLDARESCGCP